MKVTKKKEAECEDQKQKKKVSMYESIHFDKRCKVERIICRKRNCFCRSYAAKFKDGGFQCIIDTNVDLSQAHFFAHRRLPHSSGSIVVLFGFRVVFYGWEKYLVNAVGHAVFPSVVCDLTIKY